MLESREYSAGRHEMNLDLGPLRAADRAPGMRFVRLRLGAEAIFRPLVMLR